MLPLILLACMHIPTPTDTNNFSLFNTERSCQEGLAINIVGKDGKMDEIAEWTCNCHDEQGKCIIPIARITAEPEPVDVPAVQVKEELCNEPAGLVGRNGELIHCGDWKKRWTCKNPKRILMHDESNPPKYWCHKVEP